MSQNPQFQNPFKYSAQQNAGGNYNIEMVTPDPTQYQDPSSISTETGPLSRMLPRNGLDSVVLPHADNLGQSLGIRHNTIAPKIVINPHMANAVAVDMANTSPEMLSMALGAAQQHGTKYAGELLEQSHRAVQQPAPAPQPAPVPQPQPQPQVYSGQVYAPQAAMPANNTTLLSRLVKQPQRADGGYPGQPAVVSHPKIAVQYVLPGFGQPIQTFFHDVIHEGLVLALLHDTRYDGPVPMQPPVSDAPLHLLVPSMGLELFVTSLGLQYTANGVLHTILVAGGAG